MHHRNMVPKTVGRIKLSVQWSGLTNHFQLIYCKSMPYFISVTMLVRSTSSFLQQLCLVTNGINLLFPVACLSFKDGLSS